MLFVDNIQGDYVAITNTQTGKYTVYERTQVKQYIANGGKILGAIIDKSGRLRLRGIKPGSIEIFKAMFPGAKVSEDGYLNFLHIDDSVEAGTYKLSAWVKGLSSRWGGITGSISPDKRIVFIIDNGFVIKDDRQFGLGFSVSKPHSIYFDFSKLTNAWELYLFYKSLYHTKSLDHVIPPVDAGVRKFHSLIIDMIRVSHGEKDVKVDLSTIADTDFNLALSESWTSMKNANFSRVLSSFLDPLTFHDEIADQIIDNPVRKEACIAVLRSMQHVHEYVLTPELDQSIISTFGKIWLKELRTAPARFTGLGDYDIHTFYDGYIDIRDGKGLKRLGKFNSMRLMRACGVRSCRMIAGYFTSGGKNKTLAKQLKAFLEQNYIAALEYMSETAWNDKDLWKSYCEHRGWNATLDKALRDAKFD